MCNVANYSCRVAAHISSKKKQCNCNLVSYILMFSVILCSDLCQPDVVVSGLSRLCPSNTLAGLVQVGGHLAQSWGTQSGPPANTCDTCQTNLVFDPTRLHTNGIPTFTSTWQAGRHYSTPQQRIFSITLLAPSSRTGAKLSIRKLERHEIGHFGSHNWPINSDIGINNVCCMI